MAFFKYTGVDQDGRKVSGTEETTDEQSLRITLRRNGIFLKSFKELKEKRRSSFFSVSSKVSNAQFLSFCKQFAIMLKAGIPIEECLDSFRHQKFSTVFKNVISDVHDDVVKGMYLSNALRKHKKIFPSYFCSMVYVGELSGNLANVLVQASDYYANDSKVKRKTKTAMIYPTFLLVVVIAIFFLLMIMVVPQFKTMLDANKAEIPLITKITLAISDFVTDNLPFVILGLAAIVGGTYGFFKTKTGQIFKVNLLMRLPVIKQVQINSITARFCSSFSILLSSGMQILDAMDVMPVIIDNYYFTKRFDNVVKDLNHGRKLSVSLEKVGLFPDMLVQMTAIGENSSSLYEVYQTVGDYYTDVLNASIQRATSMLEPIVIIIMGGLVLTVLLAVMLPMFALMDSF